MRKLWPGLVLLLLAATFGLWALPRLPEQVVTHWGVNGEPNGWSSRNFAVFLIPGIMFLVAGVLTLAPRLDPKRANFVWHASAYWTVGNLVLGFMAIIHVLVIGSSLGWPLDIARIIAAGVGILFIVMGNLFSRIRPNWIFGIRTPWTLSSELSWRETHRYGGYAFVASGIIVVFTGLLWPTVLFPVLAGSIGASTIFSVVWSYLAWKRDPKTGGAS